MKIKKILCLILCMVLCLTSLAGCSGVATNNYTSSESTTTTEETTEKVSAYTIERDEVFDSSRKPVMKIYVNHANGVEVTWGTKYLGTKTVKYATVYLKFQNGVDDPAYDQLTGEDERIVRLTGPLEPGKCLVLYEHIVAYGPDIAKVQITDIELEYMDGTKDKLWYGWSSTVAFTDYDLSLKDLDYLSGE